MLFLKRRQFLKVILLLFLISFMMLAVSATAQQQPPQGLPPYIRNAIPDLADWFYQQVRERLTPKEEQLPREEAQEEDILKEGVPPPSIQAMTTDPSFKEPFIANEMLVKFPANIPEISNPRVQEALNRVQARVLERVGQRGWVRVRLTAGQRVREAVANAKQLGDIEAAEPNFVFKFDQALPSDPDFSKLWGLHNVGQTGGMINADINAPEAWARYPSSRPTTIVAVIDTGVDYFHPDLEERIWTNSREVPNNNIDDDRNGYVDDYWGWNFVNNSNNPMDDHGHGTHVAGIISAAYNNNRGITGVAGPADVRIMPLKFLDANGYGATSNAIKAIDYATTMGAHISNNSWGGGSYSQALADSITRNAQAGRLLVASAGNEAKNIDIDPSYPAAYNIENVVAVSSIAENDTLSSFSNYGPQKVHLAAPGSTIYSTLPNQRYGYSSGTSMAAPLVSGVSATLLSFNTSLTATQIKSLLMETARKTNSLNNMVSSNGVLNFEKAVLAVTSSAEPILEPAMPEPEPKVTPPKSPTNLRLSRRWLRGKDRNITLSWVDNAIDETGFEVYVSTNLKGPYTPTGKVEKNTIFWSTNLGTRRRTNLYYKVRAVNEGGPSSFSNILLLRPF